MNTKCTVCHHPQRAEIEQAHLAGVPMREVGKRFDRSKTTIAKHIKLHVPEAALGPTISGVEKRAKPKKSKAHACKAPALLAVQPTPVEAADVKHDSPVPKKPVTVNHIRDVAWRVGEPVAQIEVFDLETVANLLRRNQNNEDQETREKVLRLLCRPVSQRARMQKHWNGDLSDIEATRTLFGPILAGEVLNAISYIKEAIEQPQWYPFLENAIDYVRDVLTQMQPRDPMERMLIEQSLWLHARLVRLSVQAATATGEQNLRTLNEAAERVANTYRRHMQALKDYRSASWPKFVAIGQANLANQQVVHPIGTLPKEALDGARVKAAIPTVVSRPTISSGGDLEESSMDAFDGPSNDRREDPLKHERVQARPATRTVRRRRRRSP
jgi:hypothetical protein